MGVKEKQEAIDELDFSGYKNLITEDYICLDGHFTLDELKAIVAIMEGK